RNAEATASGEQLRVLNGIYLASWKLGRTAEAEEAFGKVVALGLSINNLGVKFLFNPGSTDFWGDAQVSGPYGFWLRQIARQAAATKVCMTVIGHTSRTGTAQYNDRLSHRRAAYIKGRPEPPIELNGQQRLGPVRRQIGVERVDQQRQQTVVAHDQGQLDDALAPELLQRRLKRPAADATGPEEFAAVVHHRGLVERQG